LPQRFPNVFIGTVQRTAEIGARIYVKTGARLGHDQGKRATPELERLETRSSGCDAQPAISRTVIFSSLINRVTRRSDER
jgi:hypothetical protein